MDITLRNATTPLSEWGESATTNTSVKAMAEELITIYMKRLSFVDALVSDIHGMINSFRKKRAILSNQLQEFLAQHEHLRKKDFVSMMGTIMEYQRQKEEEIKYQLTQFRENEEMIIDKLQQLVFKGASIRIYEFKRVLNTIRYTQGKDVYNIQQTVESQLQKMREDVEKMLEKFKEERLSL